jgi:hypothetical protein
MVGLAPVLLSGAVWVGTAQVFVMNWEGGGEHPYRSGFQLRYREGEGVALRDARGAVVGRRVPLLPERIHLTEAAIAAPLQGRASYQLVLPRAYGAYACGQGQRNQRDARAGVGGRIFPADLEFDDDGPRFLDAAGTRMQGTYTYTPPERRRVAPAPGDQGNHREVGPATQDGALKPRCRSDARCFTQLHTPDILAKRGRPIM